MAPVLTHLDPFIQIVVELDTSDPAVGVLLSQCSTTDKKLHPCAFCHHLYPAEGNYDIGNQELLTVILALQE